MLYIIYRVKKELSDQRNGFARVWQDIRNFFRRFGKKKTVVASSETKDNAGDNQVGSNEEIQEKRARVIPSIDD